MKRKQNFEIPWWDDWYNADMLKRLELVKKLLITRELTKMFVNMKIKRNMLKQQQPAQSTTTLRILRAIWQKGKGLKENAERGGTKLKYQLLHYY